MKARIVVPAGAMVGLALGACGGNSHSSAAPNSSHASTPSNSSHASTPSSSSHASLPSDTASPEDVVRAYVAAVNAKDCATAKTLATDGGSWCGGSTLSDLQITGTTDQTRDGKPTEKVKDVSVTFTLHGGDGSLTEGHHTWGYLLDRTGPHGAWRIYDQGVA